MWDKLLHQWLRVPYALHVHTDNAIKQPRATLLFIHGIGNNGGAWKRVIEQMPPDVRTVTIDLLGFGASAKPKWAVYNAKTQARSVMTTLIKLRLKGPVVIVGHSLGTLVAVEIAKRYPLFITSMVLCSPPFYKAEEAKRQLRFTIGRDNILRELYKIAQKRPDQFVKFAKAAIKLGLVNESFRLTKDDMPFYVNALEASIINQSSLHDIAKLHLPIRIIYGLFDPVVIAKNLKQAARQNKNITITTHLGGHEVKGTYINVAAESILKAIQDISRR